MTEIRWLNGISETTPYRIDLDFTRDYRYTLDQLTGYIRTIPEVKRVESFIVNNFEAYVLVYYQGISLRELDYKIGEWRRQKREGS